MQSVRFEVSMWWKLENIICGKNSRHIWDWTWGSVGLCLCLWVQWWERRQEQMPKSKTHFSICFCFAIKNIFRLRRTKGTSVSPSGHPLAWGKFTATEAWNQQPSPDSYSMILERGRENERVCLKYFASSKNPHVPQLAFSFFNFCEERHFLNMPPKEKKTAWGKQFWFDKKEWRRKKNSAAVPSFPFL